MFDFRYHALSLVAVFLALAIGVVLGATIGDSLVSEAGKGLSSSLHNDVVNARRDAREAKGQLGQRDKIISAAFPMVVQNELAGQRVALVAVGSLPSSVESEVRQAVEVAGGTVDSVSTFDMPGQLEDLESAAGDRGAIAGREPDLVKAFARRIGSSIDSGGSLVRRLHKGLPDALRGDLRGAGAVAFYRAPPPDNESDDDKKVRESFESGLAIGLGRSDVPVVGVEEQSTDPSQVGWYEDQKMSTVDSVDLPGGQVALVYALGGESGNYGVKDTAKSALPKLPVGSGGG